MTGKVKIGVAADNLHDLFEDEEYFVMVGEGVWDGIPAIFLYVRWTDGVEVPETFQGHPVKVRELNPTVSDEVPPPL